MSSSTPRPTMPSAIVMTVFVFAPTLVTSDGGRPLYIWFFTNMWHSASTWLMPRPCTWAPRKSPVPW